MTRFTHQNGNGEIPVELAEAIWLLINSNFIGGDAKIGSNKDVPIWERYTLTIEEAANYFRIGEKKLRRIAEENKDSSWVIMNGNRIQIIRKLFEKFLEESTSI